MMPKSDTKQVVLIAKSGPAFTPDDVQAAHAELDQCGVPRMVEDRPLSLRSRIAFLHGQLESLRHAMQGRAA
jgi:hypothetical protein